MPKHGRGTLVLLRALAGLLIGLFMFCVALPAAGASTPTPSPTPRVLPISLHLGKLDLSVVVPLTLNGLLGKTPPPPTTTPPTPPPTTPPPTTSTPPSRPATQPATPSTHAPAATEQASHAPYPPRPASGGAGPATRPATHHSSAAAAPSKARSKHRTPGGIVFVKDLVPASGSLLLIALCAACALGVVAVLKLNGRSTHEH